MPAETVFSKIITSQLPAQVVYRDERVIAIRDIHPQAPTHILIIPVKPIPSVAEATPDDAALLGQLLLTAHQVARQEGLTANGYRLVINTGPDGGQTVPHLHVHLLGGRRMAWPPG